MTTLIGVSGPIGSGKTTFAKMLCDSLGNAAILHFADTLKDACAYAFAIGVENFHDPKLKELTFDCPMIVHESDLKMLEACYRPLYPFEFSEKVYQKFLGLRFETPRHLLQVVGTDILRDCVNADIHVKAHRRRAQLLGTDYVIVPDVRFVNELDAVDQSYYIISSQAEAEMVRKSKNHVLHASEWALPYLKQNADIPVVNDGTLEDLTLKARVLAQELQRSRYS